VSPDTVIGVVELMKQFNEVLAGVAGVVRSFVVADGDAVDADIPLLLIDTGNA
jgi:biotin carboxyl carrier protein